MILKKLILTAAIFLTTNLIFAQPGLNVQNRINSKVQTRVQGKVMNSAGPKATQAPNTKVEGSTPNNTKEAPDNTAVKVTTNAPFNVTRRKVINPGSTPAPKTDTEPQEPKR